MEFALFRYRMVFLPVLALGALLGGCAVTPPATTVADATLALDESEAILATLVAAGTVTAAAQGDATLLTGALRAAIAAFGSQAAGASMTQVLAAARASVARLMADSGDRLVEQGGTLALAAIDRMAAGPTASSSDARTQVVSALAALLIDDMAALAPAASRVVARDTTARDVARDTTARAVARGTGAR
jgi:hypothetical protein